MARLPADPGARLETLEPVRAEIEDDLVLSMADMARVAGMTPRNLGLIIDKDPTLPIRKRGGQGVAWEFEAAKVLDHLIAQARAARSEREARQAKVNRLGGLASAAVPLSGSTERPAAAARDMLDDARALSALIDVQAKMRAEKRAYGLLLDSADVERFLWRSVSGLQSESLAVEARVDRLEKLTPDQRQEMKEGLADAIASYRSAIEKQIGEWNAARH
jgi:hypothetical protein